MLKKKKKWKIGNVSDDVKKQDLHRDYEVQISRFISLFIYSTMD